MAAVNMPNVSGWLCRLSSAQQCQPQPLTQVAHAPGQVLACGRATRRSSHYSHSWLQHAPGLRWLSASSTPQPLRPRCPSALPNMSWSKHDRHSSLQRKHTRPQMQQPSSWHNVSQVRSEIWELPHVTNKNNLGGWTVGAPWHTPVIYNVGVE